MDPLNTDKTQQQPGDNGSGASLQPDSTLGQYRIIKLLGRGGMGEVYLAENIHNKKRWALKILPRELSSDSQFVERFKIESRVMSDLDHHNIVRVHQMGVHDGQYYLTMDYIEGPDGESWTLEDELEKTEKLPEKRVKEISLQICDALSYAHTFNSGSVIHRDLKPSNILLDSEGNIRVCDFGLAKVLGAQYLQTVIDKSIKLSMAGQLSVGDGDTEARKSSSARSILGTYDYMSPEQKAGGEVSVQSDIYSFGVMLYRALTGRMPEGRWKSPSNYGCSKGWDSIVGRCMEAEHGDRYASIESLKAAIQKVGGRSLRWLAIAALVCLVSGGTYYGWHRYEKSLAEKWELQQEAETQRQKEEAVRRAAEKRRLAELKEREEEAERKRQQSEEATMAAEERQRIEEEQRLAREESSRRRRSEVEAERQKQEGAAQRAAEEQNATANTVWTGILVRNKKQQISLDGKPHIIEIAMNWESGPWTELMYFYSIDARRRAPCQWSRKDNAITYKAEWYTFNLRRIEKKRWQVTIVRSSKKQEVAIDRR